MGYGVLSRADARTIEHELEQSIQATNASSFEIPMNRPEDHTCRENHIVSCNASRVMSFMSTMNKTMSPVSNEPNTPKNLIAEEIISYRSLAQQWFDDVIAGKKVSDAVSTKLTRILILIPVFFFYTSDGILAGT